MSNPSNLLKLFGKATGSIPVFTTLLTDCSAKKKFFDILVRIYKRSNNTKK
jgi:hypothetical protein